MTIVPQCPTSNIKYVREYEKTSHGCNLFAQYKCIIEVYTESQSLRRNYGATTKKSVLSCTISRNMGIWKQGFLTYSQRPNTYYWQRKTRHIDTHCIHVNRKKALLKVSLFVQLNWPYSNQKPTANVLEDWFSPLG